MKPLVIIAAWVILLTTGLVLFGCTTTPSSHTAGPTLPDVPPPDFTTLPPEPPPDAASAASPAAVEAVAERATIEESFLPGVKRNADADSTASVSEDDAEQPFAEKLQKRKKRVDLGLEKQGSESAPVDNILDFEF